MGIVSLLGGIKKYSQKYKKECIFVVIECIVLFLLGIWMLLGKDVTYFHFQGLDEVENLHFQKGTYRAYVNYESDDPASAVTFISESANPHMQVDTLQLYPWAQTGFLQLWFYDHVPDVKMAFHDNSGHSKITEITIIKTAESRKMVWMTVFGIMIAIHGLALLVKAFQKEADKKGFVLRASVLALSVMIVSAPLFLDSLLEGDDLLFHLTRIEGIKEALQTGQFPARIQPNWFGGAGYALSVFYGDFMLYLAVILRIFGFSLQTSYKAYLFLVTAGTMGTTYYALQKSSRNKWAAAIGTSFYLLSTYRFCDMYTRASVGEFTSMMFTPLVLCGFYQIFQLNREKKQGATASLGDKVPVWLMPAIGMAGVLATHCITSLMLTVALGLWCLCNVTVLFKKPIFQALCKTVVVTILLSAGWLIPFGDYMLHTSVSINQAFHAQVPKIQETGITIGQLFSIIPDCKAIQVFGLLYFLIVLLGVLRAARKIRMDKKVSALNRQIFHLFFVFIVLVIASTNLFPWDLLVTCSKSIATFAQTIQFPFRLAAIAQMVGILICVLSYAEDSDAKKQRETEQQKKKAKGSNGLARIPLIGLEVFGLLLGLMIAYTFVVHPIRYKIFDEAGTGLFTGYGTYATFFSYGGEYLPEGVDLLEYRWQQLYPDAEVTVDAYTRNGTRAQMFVQNRAQEERRIALPMIYYPGYQAEYENGSVQDATKGENAMVTVSVPSNYQGRIAVDYQAPWHWHIAEGVSLVCVLFCLLTMTKAFFCGMIEEYDSV